MHKITVVVTRSHQHKTKENKHYASFIETIELQIWSNNMLDLFIYYLFSTPFK